MLLITAKYTNPYGKVHTLQGVGGSEKDWIKFMHKQYGKANITVLYTNVITSERLTQKKIEKLYLSTRKKRK